MQLELTIIFQKIKIKIKNRKPLGIHALSVQNKKNITKKNEFIKIYNIFMGNCNT